MSRWLFVDTSAWLARMVPPEAGHGAIVSALDASQGRLLTTNFVIDELITLTLKRYGHSAALQLADGLTSGDVVDVHRVTADDERDALELFRERPDQRYAFTDCTSFVVMRRLGIDTVVTLDGDFRREGFTVLP
jgi:predicted nucleic acid-binding protein